MENSAGNGMEGYYEKQKRIFSLSGSRNIFGVYILCVCIHIKKRYYLNSSQKHLCMDNAADWKKPACTHSDAFSGLCKQLSDEKAAEGIRALSYIGAGKKAHRQYAVFRDSAALYLCAHRRRGFWNGAFKAAVYAAS